MLPKWKRTETARFDTEHPCITASLDTHYPSSSAGRKTQWSTLPQNNKPQKTKQEIKRTLKANKPALAPDRLR